MMRELTDEEIAREYIHGKRGVDVSNFSGNTVEIHEVLPVTPDEAALVRAGRLAELRWVIEQKHSVSDEIILDAKRRIAALEGEDE